MNRILTALFASAVAVNAADSRISLDGEYVDRATRCNLTVKEDTKRGIAAVYGSTGMTNKAGICRGDKSDLKWGPLYTNVTITGNTKTITLMLLGDKAIGTYNTTTHDIDFPDPKTTGWVNKRHAAPHKTDMTFTGF